MPCFGFDNQKLISSSFRMPFVDLLSIALGCNGCQARCRCSHFRTDCRRDNCCSSSGSPGIGKSFNKTHESKQLDWHSVSVVGYFARALAAQAPATPDLQRRTSPTGSIHGCAFCCAPCVHMYIVRAILNHPKRPASPSRDGSLHSTYGT